MIGGITRFQPLLWLLVLLLSLLLATMGSAAASAERGDFGCSSLAAKTPLGLPAPRPTFGSSLPDVSKSVFKNGSLLPSAPGRTWFEADLNYTGGYRGGERLLYSNDGKLFYSGDHYKTFQQIGN